MTLVVLKKQFDYFKKDPTISANFMSDNVEFEIIGMDLNNKIFEIEFIYDSYRLILKDSGDKILIFKGQNLDSEFKNLTNNYMIDVYKLIKNMFLNKKLNDNFKESLILNKKQILKFL